MRHYRVAHDFKGEETVELTVHKGEVVLATDNVVQDGWVKVECLADTRRRGFVPLAYLEELPGEEAEALASRRSPAAGTPSTVSPPRHRDGRHAPQPRTPSPQLGRSVGDSTGAARPAQSLGEAALEYGANIAASAPRSSPQGRSGRRSGTREGDSGVGQRSGPMTPARAATGGAPIDRELLSNPNTVVDAFMKNEVYFKQLMRRRADALSQMESGLDEAAREVAGCKDRNVALMRKLRELDHVIDKERRRWTERVEEEKAFVARSLSSVSGASLGAGGSPSRGGSSRQPSPSRY